MSREVKLTLERAEERCDACPWAKSQPKLQRPRLVIARLNQAAKAELRLRGKQAPEDQFVCLNEACGAAFHALTTIAPLKDLLK